MSACLDELSDGILVLDDKATILHANQAAGVYLADRCGISYDEGKLRVSEEDDDVHFRRNLKRATSGRARELRGKRLQSGETLWVRGLSTGRAVVFIGRKHRPRAIAPELLEEALDITPAEARVAALFATGQTLPGIAAQLDLSLHTVRLHLKKVQAKTGAHRQASLVARMLEALPPVPPVNE